MLPETETWRWRVAAIGPFDQGSPLYNHISHRPSFGRLQEKVDIHFDNL